MSAMPGIAPLPMQLTAPGSAGDAGFPMAMGETTTDGEVGVFSTDFASILQRQFELAGSQTAQLPADKAIGIDLLPTIATTGKLPDTAAGSSPDILAMLPVANLPAAVAGPGRNSIPAEERPATAPGIAQNLARDSLASGDRLNFPPSEYPPARSPMETATIQGHATTTDGFSWPANPASAEHPDDDTTQTPASGITAPATTDTQPVLPFLSAPAASGTNINRPQETTIDHDAPPLALTGHDMTPGGSRDRTTLPEMSMKEAIVPSEAADFAVSGAGSGDRSGTRTPAGKDIAPNFDALLSAAQLHHADQSVEMNARPTHALAALPVHTPTGAHGWDGEVADRLVWMTGNQQQRAELVLNPPQLGRVEVSLNMSGDQTSALFVSANPAVREALEAALPRLREILADAGVNLGQTHVGADTGRGDAQQSANKQENGGNSALFSNTSNTPINANIARQASSIGWTAQGSGLINTFA